MDGDASLPASLWSTPEVAKALASCDLPAIIEAVQHARGWTQAEVGRVLGYSQGWVSRVVRGRQPLTIDQAREIALRLGVPLGLLRLGTDGGGGDEATKRREFGKAVVLAGLAVGQPVRQCSPERVRDGADEATVAAVRSITGCQRRLDATTPSRELVRSVLGHLDLSRRLLARTQHSSLRREMAAAASEAAGFAAWLHMDMYDVGTARSYYRLAIEQARKAGHPVLAAYMLGSLASFEIEDDDPVTGRGLLVEARRHMGASPPATARAWVSCLEALGHATARESDATRRALDRADEAVEQAQWEGVPPWPWVFAFDHVKVAGYRALCAVRLGQAEEARDAFEDLLPVLATRSAKQHALLLVEQATAYVRLGEVNHGFDLASRALRIGVEQCSERVVHRVRRFRREYAGPLARAVRDLDDQLRTA